MQVLTLIIGQKAEVEAVPKDDTNTPASLSSQTFAVDAPGIINCAQNANPNFRNNATVFSLAVGTVIVTFSGVNNAGATITGQFQVTVTPPPLPPPATHVDFVFGPAVAQ